MNALMYFGRQNLTTITPDGGVGTAENPITDKAAMNNITYQVNPDAVDTDST